MTVPIAVSPSVLTPGLYLVVDLLASAVAPGIGQLRTLIMAPRSTDGDLTVDTEVRTIGDADEARTVGELLEYSADHSRLVGIDSSPAGNRIVDVPEHATTCCLR